jgi:hypothetical protein
MVNFTPMFVMLGVSLALFFIGGLMPAKATRRKNRVVQRTPRPAYWVEGNTVYQYKGLHNER